MIEAVIFDWGGTLSTIVASDLLDVWRAAAVVLAPERADGVAAELVAAERDWWSRVISSGGSGTTVELVADVAARTCCAAAALYEQALDAYLEPGRHTCGTTRTPSRC